MDDNNQSSTSLQHNKQSILFRLPLEIRSIIYESLLVIEGTVKLADGSHCNHLIFSLRASDCSLPSKIALCHASRQAYQESTSTFYRKNHFELAFGSTARSLLRGVQPVHIQLIRKLTIHRDADQSRNCDDFGLKIRSDDRGGTSWLQDFGGPKTTALLSHFLGLEELHIQTICQTMQCCAPLRQRPAKAFMQSLVKRGGKLVRLRKIVLSNCIEEWNVQSFRDFRLDGDEIPGWVYSAEFGRYWGWNPRHIVEVLERVHEPWWPQARRGKGVDGEGQDRILEEAMGLFSAAVSQ